MSNPAVANRREQSARIARHRMAHILSMSGAIVRRSGRTIIIGHIRLAGIRGGTAAVVDPVREAQ